MARPYTTEAQLQRRKKAQAGLSTATGVLGLAGLGALGAAKAPKGAARLVPKALKGKVSRNKALGASAGLTTLSAGVGGAGSLNLASVQSAEARKRKADIARQKEIRQGVKKSDRFSAFGVEH